MQRGTRVDVRETPPGLVATVGAALSAFLVQPLPILIPIAVDLVLWSAPRLALDRLIEPVRLASAQNTDPVAGAMLQELSANGTLMMILGFLVPSLLVGVDRGRLFAPWPATAIDPGSILVLLGWAALLFIPGVLLAMTYRVWLGRVTRDQPLLEARQGRVVLVAALRYLAYLGLVTLVLLALAMGSAIVAGVFLVVGLNLLPLITVALGLIILAGGLALAFVQDAIALVGVGPLRAIQISLDIVRRYPWPALGLLVGSYLVLALFAVFLSPMVATAVGLALAILAFAFVSTVLGLARMRFLADRLPPTPAIPVPR